MMYLGIVWQEFFVLLGKSCEKGVPWQYRSGASVCTLHIFFVRHLEEIVIAERGRACS